YDGNVGPDCIQVLLPRAGRRKGEVAPAEAADDPLRLDLVAIRLERAQSGFPRVELKVRSSCEGSADERMDVALDKSGKQHFAGQIHDACLRSDVRLNVRLVADADDALAF